MCSICFCVCCMWLLEFTYKICVCLLMKNNVDFRENGVCTCVRIEIAHSEGIYFEIVWTFVVLMEVCCCCCC